MARFGLLSHRKFLRLARLLAPHCQLGGEVAAMGVLELLWYSAYESASDDVGTPDDLAGSCRWPLDPLILTSALVESGFVDLQNDTGRLTIHDLWQHAPPAVREKAEREAKRTAMGLTLSQVRAEAGRLGAEARLRTLASKRLADAEHVQSNGLASARQPRGNLLLGTGRDGTGPDPPIAPQGGRPPAKPKTTVPRGQQPADLSQLTEDEKRLVTYWREQCDHPRTRVANLDIERLRACLADKALAGEFEVTTLRIAGLAIRGCSLSDFHMGREPGKTAKHNDLSLIFRDPKHIRRFAGIALAAKGNGSGERPTQQSFLERDRAAREQDQARRPELEESTAPPDLEAMKERARREQEAMAAEEAEADKHDL